MKDGLGPRSSGGPKNQGLIAGLIKGNACFTGGGLTSHNFW